MQKLEEMLSVDTPNETLIGLGRWLRTERQRIRWTQGELSRRSGVPSATISRLELTGLASTEAVFKVLFALNRLGRFMDFLKECQRLAEMPVTLSKPVVVHTIQRIRKRKGEA